MPDTETERDAAYGKIQTGGAALVLGNAVATAEDEAIQLGTNRLYRVRARHPYLYGAAAFIIGGSLASMFMMTTYANWAYEGVNLTTATYQIVSQASAAASSSFWWRLPTLPA